MIVCMKKILMASLMLFLASCGAPAPSDGDVFHTEVTASGEVSTEQATHMVGEYSTGITADDVMLEDMHSGIVTEGIPGDDMESLSGETLFDQ